MGVADYKIIGLRSNECLCCSVLKSGGTKISTKEQASTSSQSILTKKLVSAVIKHELAVKRKRNTYTGSFVLFFEVSDYDVCTCFGIITTFFFSTKHGISTILSK